MPISSFSCFFQHIMKFESLVLIFGFVAFSHGQIYLQPEQVHLSMGANQNQMVVTWVTQNATQSSVAEYGTDRSMSMNSVGNATKFVDGGKMKRVLWIHRVTLTVTPGQSYFYHVGSPMEAWSAVFYFTAQHTDDPAFSPRIAMYGDLGNINSRSMAYLQQDVQRGNFDAIFHVGDFAYDMDSNNAMVGDEFMRMTEAVAAYVPYMVCPGNHEMAYNFSNYINRFSMPGGSNNNLFFSFNIGPAHVISFSTEYYFFGFLFGFDSVFTQYNWLIEDLKEANKPENRYQRPWIITMGHRPMYCSNNDDDDCTKERGIIRTGLPFYSLCGLEDIFVEYGVDFSIWAHEHSYERLWPVYNTTVRNGTTDSKNPYHNPNGIVHITTGSAGCQEDHDAFVPNPAPWSALRVNDYGFSTMNISNGTHIHLQYFSVDKDSVVDDVWLVKDQPWPSYYGELSRKEAKARESGAAPQASTCKAFLNKK